MLEYSRLDAERKITLAIQLIRERIKTGFSLTRLAADVGLSAFYFSRLFKKLTGETPYSTFRRERFLAVDESLRKNPEESLTNLALEFGFSSSSALTREFQTFLGVMPKVCKSYFQDQQSSFGTLRTHIEQKSGPVPPAIERHMRQLQAQGKN